MPTRSLSVMPPYFDKRAQNLSKSDSQDEKPIFCEMSVSSNRWDENHENAHNRALQVHANIQGILANINVIAVVERNSGSAEAGKGTPMSIVVCDDHGHGTLDDARASASRKQFICNI